MTRTNVAIIASLVLSIGAALASGAAIMMAAGVVDTGRSESTSFDAQARAYLMDNPEVLMESVQRLEEQRQASAANELTTMLRDRAEEIFNDPSAPVLGNPAGDVTLVEFFDYNCPYCRKAAPILDQAEAADSGLRLVFKEFPILGPGSNFAARAALASLKQGKYEAFHDAMMAHSAAIDETSTLEIAGQVGLDVELLKKDMQDPAIDEAIKRNLALAGDLRINGTPSFVVGDEIIRGLTDLPTLQGVIADTRAATDG